MHALLERLHEEWSAVDDGGSRNGSFVNGERVDGRRRLRDGDVLRVGEDVDRLSRAVRWRFGPDPPAPATTRSRADRRPAPGPHRGLPAVRRLELRGARIDAPDRRGARGQPHDTVKTHLRALFDAFGIEALPQNQKRADWRAGRSSWASSVAPSSAIVNTVALYLPAMPKIVTLPGDGIGPEVLASALEVLAAVADHLVRGAAVCALDPC